MIKPSIGECADCKQHTEVWEGYGDRCTDCFNKQTPSKFTINGVPLVQVVESILMERPLIKRIIETAMLERGAHRIIRLEEDGHIYKVEPEWSDQITRKPPLKEGEQRPSVIPADPELITKLNGLVDDHVSNCAYCQSIIEMPE